MRFGLFYEHQLPRPWAEGAEERLLRDALEQVELADRVGFHSVWEVEHHFLEEYSHSAAPEVFLAAASQRTQQIRLGHGIVQLPPPFNHPARVAERIATLDLVSGGRVEFGTGESSSQSELGAFGVAKDLKRAQWEEALEVVTRLMVEEPFAGHEGTYVSIPPRNLVPKPKQKPHPPLWVACSRRDTILLAARKGLGALSFSFIEPEAAREWVDQYYSLLESDECVPAGFSVHPNVAVVLPFMCHPDEETAIERGIDGGHFFGYSLAHYYVFGEHRPGRTNVWEEFQEHRSEHGFAREIVEAGGEQLGINILQQGLGSLRGAIGTPQQVAELCSRYEAAGVDQIIFVAQAGKNRHEHICESIELFGKEILPRFGEKADEVDAARTERYAEAVGRALARRQPPRTADAGYVITPNAEPRPARLLTLSSDAKAAPLPGAQDVSVRDTLKRQKDQWATMLGRADLPDKLRARGEQAFASFVKGRDDDAIDRVVGTRQVQRMIFQGMARAFLPEKAGGFTGELQYELSGRRGTVLWRLVIDLDHAEAMTGRASNPALTIKTSVPTFARMVTDEVPAAKAWFEGKVQIEGDFQVASRLGEMFGQTSTF